MHGTLITCTEKQSLSLQSVCILCLHPTGKRYLSPTTQLSIAKPAEAFSRPSFQPEAGNRLERLWKMQRKSSAELRSTRILPALRAKKALSPQNHGKANQMQHCAADYATFSIIWINSDKYMVLLRIIGISFGSPFGSAARVCRVLCLVSRCEPCQWLRTMASF